MTNHGETFQRVSVAEAARRLGLSVATVRRRIRTGELEAETVIRPQGTAFMVRLPLDASAGDSDAYDRDQQPRVVTPGQASGQDAMVSLIQATISTILGPLVAELAEQRQANERQAAALREQGERVAGLEREAGTLTERLTNVQQDRDRLRAALSAAEETVMAARTPESPSAAPTVTEAAAPATEPRWRVLWPLLTAWTVVAIIGAVIVLIGAATLWPR
jgi:hypothetical protein